MFHVPQIKLKQFAGTGAFWAQIKCITAAKKKQNSWSKVRQTILSNQHLPTLRLRKH